MPSNNITIECPQCGYHDALMESGKNYSTTYYVVLIMVGGLIWYSDAPLILRIIFELFLAGGIILPWLRITYTCKRCGISWEKYPWQKSM